MVDDAFRQRWLEVDTRRDSLTDPALVIWEHAEARLANSVEMSLRWIIDDATGGSISFLDTLEPI